MKTRESEAEQFMRRNTPAAVKRPIACARNIDGFGTRWSVAYSDDASCDPNVPTRYLDTLEACGFRVLKGE